MVNIESFPMNADGPHSYTENSAIQKGVLNRSQAIDEAITEMLDIKQFSTTNPFTIADLGCSIGPNTFVVVKNIVDAIELKYKQCPNLNTPKLSTPEFLVYFNDHVANDFNMLFRSIPPNKKYFATGVPGSFYDRLFPKRSLQFVHSSYTLHWLSMVPKELVDKTSPAWNKGRIIYANAPNEVVEAYSAQFAKDMSSFLKARAQELAPGGLMALLLLCTEDEKSPPAHSFIGVLDFMGSCLLDMAKLGLLRETEIDSFNLPIYNTSPKEVEGLIERDGCFNIEKMETLVGLVVHDAQLFSRHMRAIMETTLKEYFGSEIMDELFNRLTKKIAESNMLSECNPPPWELLIILKLKVIK